MTESHPSDSRSLTLKTHAGQKYTVGFMERFREGEGVGGREVRTRSLHQRSESHATLGDTPTDPASSTR